MRIGIYEGGSVSGQRLATALVGEKTLRTHVEDALKARRVSCRTAKRPEGAIRLDRIYDGRKLLRAIRAGNDVSTAEMGVASKRCHLTTFRTIYWRKEWNPLSQFYVEPWGEKLGKLLSRTPITPNGITFLNIVLSVGASALLFLGPLGIILFGLWVRLFHLIDIIDGMIARWACKGSLFGRWFDGAADRVVVSVWYIAISVMLHLTTGATWPLYTGLVVLASSLIYHYLMLTSVAYFRNNDFSARADKTTRTNLLSRVLLVPLAHDVQMHALTILALLGHLDWFLLFYAGYFPLVSLLYFVYYYHQYLRHGDVGQG